MTADDRITARRAELMKQRAERQDELDLPRTLTMRQVREYLSETAKVDQQVAAFDATVERWAALPPLEPDVKWRDFLVAARQTIDGELTAMHPRIRNKEELAQQQDLTFCLRQIDTGLSPTAVTLAPTRLGQLMAEAGYDVDGPALRGPNGWQGSLKEVEQRITTLTRQRADAQAGLDSALISDEERAAQEAEAKQLRDAYNGLNVKVGDASGLVAYRDGAVLPLDEMTELERRAFEKANAAFRAEREPVSS